MELPLKCVSGECEVHTVIRFLTAENLSASAIHKRLQNAYDVNGCQNALYICGHTDFARKSHIRYTRCDQKVR